MSSITRPKDPLSWLWLLIAAALLPFFALGYRTVAIAAFFAPVFLLRLSRTQRRTIPALILVLLVHGVIYTLASYNEFFGWSISLLLALFFASAHTGAVKRRKQQHKSLAVWLGINQEHNC